ncbi:hypothetical protein BAJT_18595 [Bacillus velezensis]|nr:hypothetical protein A5891_18190 [Bacillus velezensis]APQ50819.1 hypothetical protein BSO20_12805 [Bacillus amyloliquefaciens]ARM29725.1 hypothetical protein B9C48_18605 [Bacillus vallismortis]ANU31970.1 hypothetical protein A8142_18065 [Bacillus velezensis]AQZ71540.1 hypothetical protein BLL65_00490 [Bacillus velezensis]
MFANQKSKLFFQSFTNQIAIEVKRYIVKSALLITYFRHPHHKMERCLESVLRKEESEAISENEN